MCFVLRHACRRTAAARRGSSSATAGSQNHQHCTVVVCYSALAQFAQLVTARALLELSAAVKTRLPTHSILGLTLPCGWRHTAITHPLVVYCPSRSHHQPLVNCWPLLVQLLLHQAQLALIKKPWPSVSSQLPTWHCAHSVRDTGPPTPNP